MKNNLLLILAIFLCFALPSSAEIFMTDNPPSASSGVQSVNGQTGIVTLSIPSIPTNVSVFADDAGYITASNAPVKSVNGRTGAIVLANTDVGLGNVVNVDTTNAANITSGILPPARLPTTGVAAGTYNYASMTVDSSGRITSASNGSTPTVAQAYDGTIQRLNVFPIFFAGTTNASGVITINLTVDGTTSGAPIYPNGVISKSVNYIINSNVTIYPGSWAWSNGNKTLTFNLTQAGSTNVLTSLLGAITGVLGVPSTASSGVALTGSVWVY